MAQSIAARQRQSRGLRVRATLACLACPSLAFLAAAMVAVATATPAVSAAATIAFVVPDPSSPLFRSFVAVAGARLRVERDATLTGNVHGNDEVDLDKGDLVTGNVSAVGRVDDRGHITGTVTQHAPARMLPLLPTAAQARALATRVFEQDTTFTDATIDDVVFVAGDVHIKGSLDGQGTVIAEHDLVLAGADAKHPVTLAASTRLSLLGLHDVHVGKARPLRGLLLAGHNAELETEIRLAGVLMAAHELHVEQGCQLAFLELDITPPTISNLTPPAGGSPATATPTISATFADDLSGVDAASARLLLDAVDQTAHGQVTASGIAFMPAQPLAAGGHAVTLTVSDLAGNQARAQWSFSIGPPDTTPPAITIGSPLPGTLVNTGRPPIAVSYADDASGVDPASVRLLVDGTDQTAHAQVTAASAAFTPSSPLPDGAHVVVVVAADRAGNQARASWSFTVDTVPPAVTSLAPLGGSVLHNPAPVLGAAFADATSGVSTATVRLLLDGVDQTAAARITATGLVLVPGAPLPDGAHTAVLTLADLAGNVTRQSWSFTTDTVPPSLAITAPAVAVLVKQPQPQIVLTYADSLSGVDTTSLQVRVDAADLSATCAAAASSATCMPAAPLAAGPHVLFASIQDQAGNTATASFSFRLVLDTTPPVITLVHPTDGAMLRTPTVQVSGTVTDDDTVASVAVDGSQVGFAGGQFATMVTLAEGSNLVLVTATDAAGNQATVSANVVLDTQPPALTVALPRPGQQTNQATIRVTGTATDANGIATLKVAGQPATLTAGAFDVQAPLIEGQNQIVVQAVDPAGNQASATVSVTRYSLPAVAITAPPDLSFLAATTVTVQGTVGEGVAAVAVNGVAATVTGTTFTAPGVPLVEGGNTLTAAATDGLGHLSTASINVVRDLTPPRVAIVLPQDGAVVHDTAVSVSGLVNDIVNGTVNSSQVTVTVNGRSATVANRSFLATGLPLAPGDNLLTVTAVDSSGNTGRAGVTVHQAPATSPRIAVVSGDHQSAVVGAPLAQPLVVALLDAGGQPVAGRQVLFRVAGNDGSLDGGRRSLAVTTGADGQAQAHFVLGTRAGVANQLVEAAAVGFGFEGPVTFAASALAGTPALLALDSGDQQLGVAGQALPRPLVAAVVDAGANRLAGVAVDFQVVQGGGSFGGAQRITTAVSDSDGRVVVPFTTGPDEGNSNNVVTAVIAGSAGGGVTFTASGWAAGDPSQTTLSGIVLDNANQPLAATTLRLRDTAITATTDAMGLFRISPAPAGSVELIVDGSTVQRPGSWPDLEYQLTTVPGRDNSLGMPIYLLPLDLAHGVAVDETHGGRLTLPEVPGFALDILPGSVTFAGGGRSGVVSVTVVHADKVPMVPNFGQQPRLIVTIQPAGARFEPPARLTLPNLEGLVPGQVTELYSFDHDLGHFVSIGPATVSDDATVIISNAGVGLLKGGWHASGNPVPTGAAHDCPHCQIYRNGGCVADDTQTLPQVSPTDCVTQVCKGGSATTVPNDSEVPPQNPDNNCTKQICKGGRSQTVVDPFFGHARQIPGNCLREICNLDGPGSEPDLNDAPPGLACCGQPYPATATPAIYNPSSQCCSPSTQVVPKGPPMTSLADCPGRVSPAQPPSHVYDGCSLPPVAVKALKVLAPGVFSGDPNNPAGGSDTQFSNFNKPVPKPNLPCDHHDECYQTCDSSSGAKDNCDLGLLAGMIGVCLNTQSGSQVQGNCLVLADIYYQGVSIGGDHAYNGDQLEFCQCCP